MARHVRKGDLVYIRTGDDRKTVAKVLRVMPGEQKVLVEGVNVKVRHIKPSQQNPQGGTIEKEMPIHISNVSPVSDGRPTRVRFESREDGAKVRVSSRTKQAVGPELKKARKG
ncbi:MAG: 50S ribosomal protein L24 [Phycisphaeraceae bacterium]|nr:50S ribosomal protein L24 [Phycisphaeraceae bacterium]